MRSFRTQTLLDTLLSSSLAALHITDIGQRSGDSVAMPCLWSTRTRTRRVVAQETVRTYRVRSCTAQHCHSTSFAVLHWSDVGQKSGNSEEIFGGPWSIC